MHVVRRQLYLSYSVDFSPLLSFLEPIFLFVGVGWPWGFYTIFFILDTKRASYEVAVHHLSPEVHHLSPGVSFSFEESFSSLTP